MLLLLSNRQLSGDDIMKRDKKTLPIFPIFLLFILLSLIFSLGYAHGQMNNSDRLQAELERTDQMIEDAKEKLANTSNVKAENLLNQAVTMQRHGWNSFHGHQLKMGAQYATKARELVTRALGLLARTDEDRALVENELERTDNILEEAGSRLSEIDLTQLNNRYSEAVKLQEKAKTYFFENNLKASLKFTLRAREIIVNATRKFEEISRLPERHNYFLERIRTRAEKNGEWILESGNNRAIELYEECLLNLDRANEFIEKGQFKKSERTILLAKEQISKAVTSIRREDNPVFTLRAMNKAENQLQNLINKAEELETDAADDLLNEAAEKLTKAREFYDQGDARSAMVATRVVFELLHQAAKILREY